MRHRVHRLWKKDTRQAACSVRSEESIGLNTLKSFTRMAFLVHLDH
jgi:hypothetical protein